MPVRSKKKIWPHARQDKAAGLINFGEGILAVAGLGYWPAKIYSATTAMRPSCFFFVCAPSYQTFTAPFLDKNSLCFYGSLCQQYFSLVPNQHQPSAINQSVIIFSYNKSASATRHSQANTWLESLECKGWLDFPRNREQFSSVQMRLQF